MKSLHSLSCSMTIITIDGLQGIFHLIHSSPITLIPKFAFGDIEQCGSLLLDAVLMSYPESECDQINP